MTNNAHEFENTAFRMGLGLLTLGFSELLLIYWDARGCEQYALIRDYLKGE